MKRGWESCRKLLCIRTDNMGDIIMSGPAIRGLKESLGCSITLLVSKQGAPVCPYVPGIDDFIICDVPWGKDSGVQENGNNKENRENTALISELKKHRFDAAIIFTVYSQSALPAALCTMMAGIPLRLAYARENPYGLLTDWYPDPEPYNEIVHQVIRDIRLVEFIGIKTTNDRLSVDINHDLDEIRQHPSLKNVDLNSGFMVVHPGVSEARREYPVFLWRQAIKRIRKEENIPVLITGTDAENEITSAVSENISGCYNVAGQLNVGEWISLIAHAKLLLSVNTASIHIAAATRTPSLVLYALTNPQHTPWKSPCRVLPFSVPLESLSKSPIVRFVAEKYFQENIPYPRAADIIRCVGSLLINPETVF